MYELNVSISGKHKLLLIGMMAVIAVSALGLHFVVMKSSPHSGIQTRHTYNEKSAMSSQVRHLNQNAALRKKVLST